MPIALAPPLPSDPKDWPVMDIERRGEAVRVAETWPISVETVADIGETTGGSGPNVVLTLTATDPSSCQWRAEQTARHQRPGWDVELKSVISLSADLTHFSVDERLTATLNGEVVADVPHVTRLPRVLM
jgi:hypothetical protein